jgi:CRP-like cAMP-binding protein
MVITARARVAVQNVCRTKGSNFVLLQPTPRSLSPALFQALQGIKTVQTFANGSTLFLQGSPVGGIYLVETGDVRILLATGNKQRQLLEIAGPGTMLGLSESMSGENYRITAEANSSMTAAFVRRDTLLNFLREHADFGMEVVRLLSEELHGLYHKFRNITAHPGRPRRRDLDLQLN